jgi:quercetin dioxygenase-like cupin family protein
MGEDPWRICAASASRRTGTRQAEEKVISGGSACNQRSHQKTLGLEAGRSCKEVRTSPEKGGGEGSIRKGGEESTGQEKSGSENGPGFCSDRSSCRIRGAMSSDRYAEFLPAISKWIPSTLDAHAGSAKPVASFQFLRLPRYFSEQLLSTTSVVVTDHLPKPPLSAWGLSEFASFEQQPMNAITYLDTYFVKPSAATAESLHFHELVHVIQWRVSLSCMSDTCKPTIISRVDDLGEAAITSWGEQASIRALRVDNANNFCILDYRAPARFGPPRHLHYVQDEVLEILKGSIAVWTPDWRGVLHAGDIVSLPAGVPHAWRSIDDQAVHGP